MSWIPTVRGNRERKEDSDLKAIKKGESVELGDTQNVGGGRSDGVRGNPRCGSWYQNVLSFSPMCYQN